MSEQAVHDWIRKAVANHDVVVFMKGTKSFPQCGFSAQVAQILAHMGVDYQDVTSDVYNLIGALYRGRGYNPALPVASRHRRTSACSMRPRWSPRPPRSSRPTPRTAST